MNWNPSILVLALTTVFLAGCAGDKNAPHPAVQSTSAPAKPKGEVVAAKAETRRSIFTLDQSSRDPFFPQARKATPAVASTISATSTPVVDLPTLMANGLQGIGGTPDRYIAIIYNVMLEKGRHAVIPIRIANQDRKFSVKCREVAKNSVALEVEGYGAMVIKPNPIL